MSTKQGQANGELAAVGVQTATFARVAMARGGAANQGGGIFSTGWIALVDTNIEANHAVYGAGLYNAGGGHLLEGTLLSNNVRNGTTSRARMRRGTRHTLFLVRCGYTFIHLQAEGNAT